MRGLRGGARWRWLLVVVMLAWPPGMACAQSPAALDKLQSRVHALLDAGQAADAVPVAEQAAKLSTHIFGPDTPQTASSYDDLAQAWRDAGQPRRGLVAAQRALSIREKAFGPQHPSVAKSEETLADLYQRAGDYPRARRAYERALAIREKTFGANHPSVARTLDLMAAMDRQAGDAADARAAWERALSVRENTMGADHPEVSGTLEDLADLAQEQGDPATARPLYERALAIREKALGPDDPGVAVTLNNLGVACIALGDAARARPLLERARDLVGRTMGPDHLAGATIQQNLACLAIDEGRPADARTAAETAEAAYDRTLSRLLTLTPPGQVLALQGHTDPTALLATLEDGPAVAEAVLRHKGLMMDAVAEDVQVSSGARSPQVAHALAALRSEQQKLAPLLLELPVGAGADDVKQMAQARDSLEQAVQRDEEALAGQVHGLGSSRRALALTVADVQGRMPAGGVLVEYLRYPRYAGKGRFEPAYGAVVIPAQGTPAWVALGPAAPLEDAVHRCQALIRQPSSSDQDVATIMQGLYTRVWSPLALPATAGPVLVSPDGALNGLPFAALLGPDGRFLGQTRELGMVASGRDLLTPLAGPVPHRVMAVVADPSFAAPAAASPAPRVTRLDHPRGVDALTLAPLPAPGEQVQALKTLVGSHADWSVQLYTAEHATKNRLLTLDDPAVVHIATHGFVLPQTGPATSLGLLASDADPGTSQPNPMLQSGLVLAGAQRTLDAWKRGRPSPDADNGILTAAESALLPLSHTWLVVLSGGDLGPADASNATLGLRRGFLRAGTDNLLLSLWSGPDNNRFLADFYQAAMKSGNAPGALAQVQSDWLGRMKQEKGVAQAVRCAGAYVLNFQGPWPK